MKTTYQGKLAIFTSFYAHTAYAPYVRSLASTLAMLNEFEIPHEYHCQLSDFHIERSVNTKLTDLMEDDSVTDVLTIDSDHSWEGLGVMRLLSHPDEIVGASYQMKNAWHMWTGKPIYKDGLPVGRMLQDGTPLLEADTVAGGFMRVKTSALRKFTEGYPHLWLKEGGKRCFSFFQRAEFDGEMWSQDCVFSRRWKDIGGQLWIDPNITIGHWGMEPHEGNLTDWLKKQNAANNAYAAIEQMAADIAKRAA